MNINNAYNDTNGVRNGNGLIIGSMVLSDLDKSILPFSSTSDPFYRQSFTSLDQTLVYYPNPKNKLVWYSVINPFYRPPNLVIKYMVGDIVLESKQTGNFGSTFTQKVAPYASHLILDMRIEWIIPATKSQSGNYYRFVDNLGLVIADNITFEFNDAVFDTLNPFIFMVEKTYKINPIRMDEFNYMIGQQIRKELKVYESIDDIQTMSINMLNLVSPKGVDANGDSVVVGMDNTITAPGYALLGVNLNDLQLTSGSVTLLTGGTSVLSNAVKPNIVSDFVVSSEKIGMIEYGYDGIQTYKTEHDEFAVITPLKFWFTKHPSHALVTAALSQDSTTQIRFNVRKFEDLVIMQNNVGFDVVSASDSSSVSTFTWNMNFKNVVMQNNIAMCYNKIPDGFTYFGQFNDYRTFDINTQAKNHIMLDNPKLVKEIFFAMQDKRFIADKLYTTYCAYPTGGTMTLAQREMPIFKNVDYYLTNDKTSGTLYSGDDRYYCTILPYYFQDYNNGLNTSHIGVVPFTDKPNTLQTYSYINFNGQVNSIFDVLLVDQYGSSSSTGFSVIFMVVLKTIVPVIYANLRIKKSYIIF